jgi:hypothetical protein
MRGIASLALAFTLVGGFAPAYALNFDFSFTNTIGSIPGTVTGEIFGLADNTADQAATNVVIDSYPPAAVGLPPVPWDIFNASGYTISTNTFTVAGGTVTAASFIETSNVNTDALKLDNGVFNTLEDASGIHVLNAGGFAGIIFTPAAVPEPISMTLLLSGLVGIGLARRR